MTDPTLVLFWIIAGLVTPFYLLIWYLVVGQITIVHTSYLDDTAFEKHRPYTACDLWLGLAWPVTFLYYIILGITEMLVLMSNTLYVMFGGKR